MTAMPPTTGHLQLVQFAKNLLPDGGVVEVILNTQPVEPYPNERYIALTQAIERVGLSNCTKVRHYSEMIEQNPEAPGFWGMWKQMLLDYGIQAGRDIIVASEDYGKTLAELTGTKFFPYDIERQINPSKATKVRDYPFQYFSSILPEFQRYVKTRVTFFGAESTGKTTTSKLVAQRLGAPWLPEYARPYLENTVNEITVDSMEAIWKGQLALQRQGDLLSTKSPYIIQDTDLFSTVGYWKLPHWEEFLFQCPEQLEFDAVLNASDLYVITKSDIPFEKDPLRYGGDVREGSDEYWISVCEEFKLNYVVLESNTVQDRAEEAALFARDTAAVKFVSLAYDRHNL